MFLNIFYWLFDRKKYNELRKEYLDKTYVDVLGIRREKPKVIRFSEKEIAMAKRIVEDGNRREAERKSSKRKKSSGESDVADSCGSGGSYHSSCCDD